MSDKYPCVFFSDEKYDFDNPDWDIHVLTGSLKLFFRELMEPLIPYKQFEMLLTGISKSLSTIVERLLEINYIVSHNILLWLNGSFFSSFF